MLNFCWSNTKIFLSILVVFWKVFCFLQKVSKFSKTVLPCSGDLVAGQSNCISLVASSYSRFSQLIGKSLSQLRKYLEIFLEIWVFRFLSTQTGNLFARESSSREGYTDIFAAPFATCRVKHLDKFFKNFVSGVLQLVLATCTRFNLVAKIVCFAQVGQFLKPFELSLKL